MGNILMLCWLATFTAGIIGLIMPKWVRLPSRWVASALLLFSLVPATAAGEFYPTADARQEPGATMVILLVAAGICALTFFLRVAMRAHRVAYRSAPSTDATFVDRIGARWAEFIKKVKQDQSTLGETRSAPSLPPLQSSGSPQEKAGLFEDATAHWRKQKAKRHEPAANSFGSDDYFADLGDEGEHGRILRTGWDQGPLQFEYVDHYGEITSRTIHKWVEYPLHVQGWCEDRKDTRTFRKDRVQVWFGATDTMLRAPKGRSRLR